MAGLIALLVFLWLFWWLAGAILRPWRAMARQAREERAMAERPSRQDWELGLAVQRFAESETMTVEELEERVDRILRR
jgi:hypothetical protein